MPTLKQMTCQIELAGSNLPLREHQTSYGDGFVETFIAVPGTQTGFSIHLTSHGYIAAGLGMFVFMDGVYQCNRYRQGLIVPTEDSTSAITEVDLRVRQKEETKGGGQFIGRDWTFEKLNTVSADQAPSINPDVAGNIGTIEVVVLRCKEVGQRDLVQPKSQPKSGSKKQEKAELKHEITNTAPPKSTSDAASAMGSFAALFDGAADEGYHDRSRYQGDWGGSYGNPGKYGEGPLPRQRPDLDLLHPRGETLLTSAAPVQDRGAGVVTNQFDRHSEVGPDRGYVGYDGGYGRERSGVSFNAHHDRRKGSRSRSDGRHHPYYSDPGSREKDRDKDLEAQHSRAREPWPPYGDHAGPGFPYRDLAYDHRDPDYHDERGGRSHVRSASNPQTQFRGPRDNPNLRFAPQNYERREHWGPPPAHQYYRPEAAPQLNTGGFERYGQPWDIEQTGRYGVYGMPSSSQKWWDTAPGDHVSPAHGEHPYRGSASNPVQHRGQRRGRSDRRQEHFKKYSSSSAREKGDHRSHKHDHEKEDHYEPRAVNPWDTGGDQRRNSRDKQSQNSPSTSESIKDSDRPGLSRPKKLSSHHENGPNQGAWNNDNYGGWNNDEQRNWNNHDRGDWRNGDHRDWNKDHRGDWNNRDSGRSNHGNPGGWNNGGQGGWDSGDPGDWRVWNGGDRRGWNNNNRRDWDSGNRGPSNHSSPEGWENGGQRGWNTGNQGEWNNGNREGWNDGNQGGWNNQNQGGWNSGGPGGWNSGNQGGWNNQDQDQKQQNSSKQRQSNHGGPGRWNDGNQQGWTSEPRGQWNTDKQGEWDNGQRREGGHWGTSEKQKDHDRKNGSQCDGRSKKGSCKSADQKSKRSSSKSQSSRSQSSQRSQETSKSHKSSRSQRSKNSEQWNSNNKKWGNNNNNQNGNNDQWGESGGNHNNNTDGQWGGNNDQWENNNGGASAEQAPPVQIANPPELKIKPYWTTWREINEAESPDASSAKKRQRAEQVYIAPDEPLHTIPQKTAEEKQVDHQVKAGRGAAYCHRVGKPEYLDSMEKPYAVFSFKYRSKVTLEQILGTSISEDPEDFKRRMLALSKDELVEELLRARGPNAQAEKSNAGNGGAAWNSGEKAKDGGAAWNSGEQPHENGAAWNSGEQAKGNGGAWNSGEQANGGDAGGWNNDEGGNAWGDEGDDANDNGGDEGGGW